MYDACILVEWGIIRLATLGVCLGLIPRQVFYMLGGEERHLVRKRSGNNSFNMSTGLSRRNIDIPCTEAARKLISPALACAAGCSFPGVE